MNAILFAATVLIWGTTWIAIAMQVGPVPVLVSVFYRFALSAAILIAVLLASGRLRVPSRRDQPFIVAQALCLYCFNFICFYTAANSVTSGLISVVFSLSTVFNALGARIFFGTPITGRTVAAAALGVSGLLLLFGPDAVAGFGGGAARGLSFAALGTLFFSLGNMASRRNSAAGISPVTANAWGMAYGSAALLGLIVITRTPIVSPPDGRYVVALVYLAVVGSVVGFTAYLSLVARIGSSRAAYATVLFPVVALALSTLFEGYRWHPAGFFGLALALAGNAVMFGGGIRAARPAAVAEPSK